MPIRITGMNSGLDTEALVSELVSAHRKKTEKYTKAQTKLSWKQDAWKTLNSKISTFFSKLTGLKYSSAYSTKKASVSDSTKASVSANSSAVNGSYSLKINETAKAGSLTGAALDKDTTSGSTLSSLGFSGSGSINLTVGGETKNISVDQNTTISDFITSLRDAGVNASYDSTHHRIYVSAKKSGVENDFTLTGANAAGVDALSKLGLNVDSVADTSGYEKWAAYALNSDGEAYITYDEKGKAVTHGTYDANKTKANIQKAIDDKRTASTRISNYQAKIEYATAYKNNDTAKMTEIENNLSGEDFAKIKSDVDSVGLDAYVAERRQDIQNALNDINNNNMLNENITSPEGIAFYETQVAGAIEILTGAASSVSAGAGRIYATDAEIELDGIVYKGASNDFDINGLSITALAKTTEEISVTVDTDSQALYDKIKGLFKEYNTLINEMTSLYNADSARGYEPLTSEEKSSLSDSEVEEWEKKIKDSLLRRDDTLGNLLSSMKTVMFGSYTVNGQSYSLSSFGISTLGILAAADNEENAFHIDGDADDTYTSSKTDKLMAAIREDPDSVVDFFKQLTSSMYDTINSKMSSTTLSSYGKVYNDKQMAQEYSDYTTTIKKWEDKLADLEESYYKKFSAMESALAKLQSQQSSLAGMLGL